MYRKSTRRLVRLRTPRANVAQHRTGLPDTASTRNSCIFHRHLIVTVGADSAVGAGAEIGSAPLVSGGRVWTVELDRVVHVEAIVAVLPSVQALARCDAFIWAPVPKVLILAAARDHVAHASPIVGVEAGQAVCRVNSNVDP